MTKEADVRNKLRAIFAGIRDMAGEYKEPCKLCPSVDTLCSGFGSIPPCLWKDVEVEELVNNAAKRVQIEEEMQ